MFRLGTIFIIAHFGVICMGLERPGWPGYEYEADIGGWLKVHLDPTDWSSARATCHSEGALLASPWSANFTSTVTTIQASKSIPVMYSGAGLRLNSAGKHKEISVYKQCFTFLAQGSTDKEVCYKHLPYACYAPAPSCGNGYNYHSETGNCYKLHEEKQLMADAISTCRSEGGYLAKLDGGDTEKKLLSEMVSQVVDKMAYIANDDGGANYRHMLRDSMYIDYSCNISHAFICEKSVTNTETDLRD